MKKCIYSTAISTFIFLFWGLQASAQSLSGSHPSTGDIKPTAHAGITFIENKGQWNSQVKYKTGVPNGVMFLTGDGFMYNYISENDAKLVMDDDHDKKHEAEKSKLTKLHFHAYKVNFVNANANAKFVEQEKQSVYFNYFIGNNRSKWHGDVHAFNKLTQQNIYNGIDLTTYSQNNSVKYDFIVAPGADPNQIQLSFDGVKPTIDAEGNLSIKTSVNEVKELAPYTYQIVNGVKTTITSKYNLKNGILTFEFPKGYNKNEPLIIDPVLVFVTFSGGTAASFNDRGFFAFSSTYDALGNMYASCGAFSIGWPVTTGAFQPNYNGATNTADGISREVGINKYNATGTSLIYSTYFGGSAVELPHAMKVNSAGELVLVGSTNSFDLPFTTGCIDSTLGGQSDIFVAHFNLTGTALIGSTYIGGSSTEPTAFQFTGPIDIKTTIQGESSPVELTFDGSDNIWVVGNSNSNDFTTVAGGSQNTYTTSKWICQGSSYNFAGQTLTTSGTYSHTYTTGGCDSVIKLILTVGTQIAHSVSKNICPGQTYSFGGLTLNSSGVYSHIFISSGGCDSTVTLTLNVLPYKTKTVNTSICAGTNYNFGGQTLHNAGTYVDTFTTSGCDSIVTLNLSIRPYISRTLNENICAGHSYSFGTQQLHNAGTYIDTFSTLGCDSIVTLNLSVSPYIRDTVQGTFCSGGSYKFGSQTLTTAGTYIDTVTSLASCDKIITLQLSSGTTAHYHSYQSMCMGGSYVFGSQTITTPGAYTQTFTTSGCDSVVTLHLEYRPNITNAVARLMCPGGNYQFGTQTLTSAGVYTQTFPTAACDSVVTLTLNVQPLSNDTISANVCQGTSYVFGSSTLITAGTYTHVFTSSLGCDSTVTVHLTFDPYIATFITDSVCFGGSYTFGTQILTAAGTYINAYPTNGCDSVVTLTLSIRPIDTFTYTENYCAGSNYYFGGQTITTTGTYFHTFPSSSGCDSVVRLVLTGPWANSTTLSGGVDVILFKMNPACNNLLYGSYLGGLGDDSPTGLIFNRDGNLIISGLTNSNNFPTTAGTVHTTQMGGPYDGFLSIVNPQYGNMVASTYLGTAGTDQATAVQVDNNNQVYVLGRTDGAYPISPGVWTGNANGDIFVDRFDPQLTFSVQSTRMGNTNTNFTRFFPSAFLVDICKNVYVAGYFAEAGMPLSANAQQTAQVSFWFGVIEPDMTGLFYGSYFGANAIDHGHCGISRMDPNGVVYHSICCNNPTYPGTTPNSWAPNNLVSQNSTGQDIVSFKFNFEATGVHSDFTLAPGNNDTGCVPFTVTFLNTSNSATSFIWDFGDGTGTSTLMNPTHTYTDTGSFKVSMIALNPNTCITSDTSYFTIRVMKTDFPNLTLNDTVLCQLETSMDLHVTVNNPTTNNTFKWGPTTGVISGGNQATVTVNPTLNTTYFVLVTDTIPGICGHHTSDTIHIDLAPRVLNILTPDTAVCQGTVIQIDAEGTPAYSYTWSPATGVSDSTILEPTITVNQSGIYTVTGKYYACKDTTVLYQVSMQAYPKLVLSEDKFVCQGTDVTLESSVSPYRPDYIYQWSPVTPNLENPNAANTHFIADTSIVYHLNIKTPIGCSDDDSVTITVFPGGFGAVAADTGYCPGNEAQIWASGGKMYQWSPSQGLSDATSPNPIASPNTTTHYQVLITNAHNCVDTENVTVNVYPAPVLDMPDSVNVYSGEQYHLEPNTNALYFSWFPPSGINDVNTSNPLFSPQVRTRYFVTAKTEAGCVIKDSIDIIVKETVIDMPNAFAPNGGNNLFKPAKRGIATLREFNVFNRWGNKIYSSTNIDDGWDGTYNGTAQPVGVYVYTIQAVTDGGRVFTQSGNVTLIR
jgi:gliding motility-associated-like protein